MTTSARRTPMPITPDLRDHAAAVHRSTIVTDGMWTDHIEDLHNKLRWNEPYLRRPDQTIRITNIGVTPR